MANHQVLICLRNRLLSESLSSVLMDRTGFDCSSVNSDDPFEYLQQFAETRRGDLLILDPTLKSNLAMTLVQRFRTRFPDSRLILLIAQGDIDRLIEFSPLQGHGWVLDDASLSDLGEAIQVVMSGATYVAPRIAGSLVAQIGSAEWHEGLGHSIDRAHLTAREREVLYLISHERLSNKQIAKRLDVSLFTAKNHVHNIIEKMGVADRHEAAESAIRRKLLLCCPAVE